jgi:uridine kinase
MYHSNFQEILADIVNGFRDSKRVCKNYLVGISGIDCAGKSTLSDRVKEQLTTLNIQCVSISGDDFLMEKKVRNANPNQALGYYNDSFDYEKLFRGVLIPATTRTNFKHTVPVMDLLTDSVTQTEMNVRGPCVVLVEGVFLFKQGHPNVFDYKLWIDLSFEEGLARAERRPRDLAHYGSVDNIRHRYLSRLYAGQRLHIDLDRPQYTCDALINANYHQDEAPRLRNTGTSRAITSRHVLNPGRARAA